MQSDEILEKIVASFAADLKSFIKDEINRQVKEIVGSGVLSEMPQAQTDKSVQASAPATNTTTKAAPNSGVNLDLFDQFKDSGSEENDFFSEAKLNELQEMALKNPSGKADTVASASASSPRNAVLDDLLSGSANTEEADQFDNSKLDFLTQFGSGAQTQAQPNMQESSVESTNQPVNAGYTPGFAGLRNLLDKVRGK